MPGNCQIPTPEAYVDQMLDYIGYSEDLCKLSNNLQ